MIEPPIARAGQRVLDGPARIGNEHRWRVALPGGARALIGQLLPEVAGQESVRRRYVRDAARVAGLGAPAVAPTLAVGPQPDPRDPAGEPPWRMRADPPGQSLASWLARRAPAPADEALELIARLADAVHGVHVAGAVLRDLEPRNVVIGDDGALWLIDLGLARVDILSTRTASSLMLESSPYSAPEHLRATVVDQRADVYTLGALLWHALTGAPPFDSGPQLFRSSAALPRLRDVAGVDESIERFVAACLDDEPTVRPESARDVAEVLRGRRASTGTSLERITCQSCGEPMRPGMRLCLWCGKQAVQFTHADADANPDARFSVILTKATDDVEFLAKLRGFFETLSEGPPPALNFLVGDARMYSKEEKTRLIKPPTPLFVDLSRPTADALAVRLRALGMKIKVERTNKAHRGRRRARRLVLGSAVGGVVGVFVLAASSPIVGGIMLGVSMVGAISGAVALAVSSRKRLKPALARLRSAPAALPASDPLVARLASLLDDRALAADVRDRVGELALLVQRLCDHRARLLDDYELAAITEPVEPLVGLIEREVRAVADLDTHLRELDEGVIVRALATSEARDEPRSQRDKLLAGLDRLRALEDTRAQHVQRLLEASSLMRRTVELGLSERGDESERDADRGVTLALAALEHDLNG